jgi:hypothetical protein
MDPHLFSKLVLDPEPYPHSLKKLDPEPYPHSLKKLDPEPDPHKVNADPKHCRQHCQWDPLTCWNIDCLLGSFCCIRTEFRLNCLTAQPSDEGRAAVEGGNNISNLTTII